MKPVKTAGIIWIATLIVFGVLLLSPYNNQDNPPDLITLIFILDVLIGIVAFCYIFIFGFLYITKNKNKNDLGKKAIMSKSQKLLSKISKKIVITFSIILTIFLLIYWFQIRPSQIKVSCQQEYDEYFNREFDRKDEDKDGRIFRDDIDWLTKRAQSKYQSCLHRNGL